MKNLFLVTWCMFFMSCDIEDITTPGLLVPLTVEQDASLPSLRINGTLLHVESFGRSTDPVVILLHGGPGGDYRSLMGAKQLTEDGYLVVFYDQRGSGLSKRENKNQYTNADAIQLFIEDLNALVNHFKLSDTQKVFLVGHSWGAMLATGYVNKYPEKIAGIVLAEPGGFTWTQTQDYLSRSNHIRFFSEALNNALFPEQIFAGRDEHEALDYKAAYFSSFENAPGNTIGNARAYPFWRSGAVCFSGLIDNADQRGFDFKSKLSRYPTKILFLYSEWNKAYGLDWAKKVSAPYPQVNIQLIKGTGHEMFYFGWDDMYSKIVNYLKELK